MRQLLAVLRGLDDRVQKFILFGVLLLAVAAFVLVLKVLA
jgi:hypothetical protein